MGCRAATGEVGKVVGYTSRGGEGRDLVRDAARALGWSEGMGREQKIGLAAALFALTPVVVMGVVTGVILLVS